MRRFVLISMAVLTLGSFTLIAAYDNIVSIRVVRSLDNTLVDTIYYGHNHQFQILVENSFTLGDLSQVYHVYSIDNMSWTWDSQPDGLPSGNTGAVTIIPGSRMDTLHNIVGQFPPIMIERDMDGVPPDTIGIGTPHNYGLTPGPLQPMLAMHFTPDSDEGITGTICIDSTRFPGMQLVFFDFTYTSPVYPEFEGPFCWPVVQFVPILGDFNLDGEINVGDVVKMIEYVFKMINHIAPIETGDVNCDWQMNIGDAVYLIAYIFLSGPAPGCT